MRTFYPRMNDKPKNQRLRNLLVVALREKGIADKDLLNATLWGGAVVCGEKL